MTERALGILPRSQKGPFKSAPVLDGALRPVAAVVAAWPGVISSTHWNLYRPSEVDGVDFYVDEEELGHIHLDGSLHLATSPTLGAALIAENLARPFRYQRGWVCQDLQTIGATAAITLFRRNYDRLVRTASIVRSQT